MAFKHAAHIQIDPSDWEHTGGDEDPSSRMLTSIQINDMSLHLEAIAVQEVNGGIQVAVNPDFDESLNAYYLAPGCDNGRFITTEIDGRTYALFALPFMD